MGFIGIGKCYKYNIYILVGVLSQLLEESLLGLNSSNKDNPGSIFSFIPKFKNHCLFKNLIYFVSSIFSGIITFFINRQYTKKKEGEITIGKIEKIQKKLLGKKRQPILLALFLTGFSLSLNVVIKTFFSLFYVHVGFWMLEVAYINIFSLLILQKKLTIHKKIAVFITTCPLLIIELFNFILPNTKHNCKIEECNELTDKSTLKYIEKRFGLWYIPLLFIIYEIITVMRDYSWVKSKYLMDIRSFAPFKILFSIGIIGSFLSIILYSIFTKFPCNYINNVTINEKNNYIKIDGEDFNFIHELCNLKYYNNNTQTLYLYYDSFSIFLNNYKEMNINDYYEIFIIIPLYFIACSINIFSHIMMISYSDPNNILISKNFYQFLKRIIVLILNKGDEKYLTIRSFIILEIQELIAIISNMIYIETIELRFLNLDYELKKSIKKRGEKEVELALAGENNIRNESEILE